jgi:hypothetical protein
MHSHKAKVQAQTGKAIGKEKVTAIGKQYAEP